MGGVTREFSLTWRDRTYVFTPTNRLLRRIEAGEVSLTHMAHEMGQGRLKMSHLAFVLAEVLRSCGARVTEDEMLAELSGGDPAACYALATEVLAAIFPGSAPEKT
jgi:hypothetical protein